MSIEERLPDPRRTNFFRHDATANFWKALRRFAG
jgi:hypothetical protein